mmetsp:Transcript_6291/g.13585  ORF Transcript_6291/g.13585 Transcript_6291/m.13585 type:complete len:86 (+) Transcript_6291:386-643(+)
MATFCAGAVVFCSEAIRCSLVFGLGASRSGRAFYLDGQRPGSQPVFALCPQQQRYCSYLFSISLVVVFLLSFGFFWCTFLLKWAV